VPVIVAKPDADWKVDTAKAWSSSASAARPRAAFGARSAAGRLAPRAPGNAATGTDPSPTHEAPPPPALLMMKYG
jgi:hypothetical protein